MYRFSLLPSYPATESEPMSKHHVRKDKTCQNCGHEADQRFCSYCGQENVETRQSFGHLLRHFIEDFTHYEGNFWKTIKYLLFRPAYLTKTYLSGKRMAYVAPVKLYIFVSFIAFFLPGILPHFHKDESPSLVGTELKRAGQELQTADSTGPEQEHQLVIGDSSMASVKANYSEYRSPEAYDSIQNTLPAAERDGWFIRYTNHRLSHLNTLPKDIVKEKIYSNLSHNFPKALFVYLPLFAFVIWLFHGKKRWLYFDHAIFTLHYFSFLLLLFTMLGIIRSCLPWHLIGASTFISVACVLVLIFWNLYYFFRAHHKMYGEHGAVSWLKSLFIFIINTVIFLFILAGFFLLTIFNLH